MSLNLVILDLAISIANTEFPGNKSDISMNLAIKNIWRELKLIILLVSLIPQKTVFYNQAEDEDQRWRQPIISEM